MHVPMDVARARHERRVYYRPRLKRILWALICFIFGASTVLALFSDAAAGNEDLVFVLTGVSLVFLGGGAAMLFRLRKRRPVVIMDADGLTVRVAPRRQQYVNWDRIADLHVFPAPRMQVLTISHKPAHSHWMDRAAFWRRGEPPAGFDSVAIPSVSVAAPLRKVEAEIRRRVPL